MESFDKLIAVVETLLGENGCEWDKKQTPESLKPCILEEAYEVLDAIDKKDDTSLCEELGDLLFLVILNAKISENLEKFKVRDVIDNVTDKMVYRHPHIFLDRASLTEGEIVKNWDNLKKKEKGYTNDFEMLKSIPKTLPALIRAHKVSKKIQKIDNNDFILSDFFEDVDDIKSRVLNNQKITSDQIGSLFFSLVTISAKYDISAEFALTNATETFINKFGRSI